MADALPDGTVLGWALLSESFGGCAGAVYEPSTATFRATSSRTAIRFDTATLLPDGTVLTAGWSPQDLSSSAETYDPAQGTFAATGKLNLPRSGHTGTLLPDGTVLACGGLAPPGWAPLSSCEMIYHPAQLNPAPVLYSSTGSAQGAILHGGTGVVASPSNPALAGEVLEIYAAGLLGGSVIPPQVSLSGRLAEVFWFGNAPGFVGLNQINVRVPSRLAPGPAVPVYLTYIRRPSNEVTIGVR